MRFTFSTDSLPPEGRFEGFRDSLARRLFQLDLVNCTDGPYRGAIDLTMAGAVGFGQVYGSAAQFVRDRATTRQCAEGVWVLLNRGGRLRVLQGDTARELGPGDGVVFDSVVAHEGRCLIESDTWVVQIPEAHLRGVRGPDADPRTLMLPGSAPATRLLSALLEAYHRTDVAHDAAVALATGQYLADLVGLAFGADGEGGDKARQRGLKAARRQAVVDDIGRHFTEPGLSAVQTALRLGVSPRYVHRVLEETGTTYSEHLLEHRLRLARRQLLDPKQAVGKVADIAYRAGFSDLSHFNRAFRRRFGVTPTAMRQAGVG
jgi:AraC-like DNA-binding protein